MSAAEAKQNLRVLTAKVNTIKSDRNRSREHRIALVKAWGVKIADAIRAEPGVNEYYLRVVKKASLKGDYWALRRRANRLTVQRLRAI